MTAARLARQSIVLLSLSVQRLRRAPQRVGRRPELVKNCGDAGGFAAARTIDPALIAFVPGQNSFVHQKT